MYYIADRKNIMSKTDSELKKRIKVTGETFEVLL